MHCRFWLCVLARRLVSDALWTADTPDVEADAADEKAAVSVRGVRKSYGATQAVKGVDLHLQLGRITALLGHNGAGKSTLVSVITGPHGQSARHMHTSPAHTELTRSGQ